MSLPSTNSSASSDCLSTWNSLNAFLSMASEQNCHELLHLEKRGKCRLTFLLRIHSRLNKVRADRERRELGVLIES